MLESGIHISGVIRNYHLLNCQREVPMSIWKTARFVRKGNYLHGSFIKQPDVDGYINSLNPGDLKDTLGRFPFCELGVDTAVACAREAFNGWCRTELHTRMLCMHRYRDQLSQNVELLSSYLTRETGKPYWEAHAEVLATIKRIDVTLEHGTPQIESLRLEELDGGYDFVPRGVVAVLGPHSMPLLVPNTHIIPALLAGNTVVFKPSKYTPAMGQLLAEMMDRARFPTGVFNMVQGSGKVVGTRLAAHPDVDAIHLDGSLDTAFELRKLTIAQPWKRLILNTCGRGTAIVLNDADLDKAAYEIVVGAFLTTGQRRSSTTRVIATSGIMGKLSRRIAQVMTGIQIGHGFDDNVYMGPLISEASRKRYLAYVQATEQEGHQPILKGARLDLDPNGYYVTPSLFMINPTTARQFLTSEEISAPALELYEASDFEEAVALHNRSRMRLVTSIFTQTRGFFQEARFRLRTGVINFNRSTVSLSARLPLEGQMASSNGMPMGLFAIRSCAYPTAYIEDYKPFDPHAIMPGLIWPETDAEPDVATDEVTAPRVRGEITGEEGLTEVTVSDLMIPLEEITDPKVARPDDADVPEPESLPFQTEKS